MGLLDSFDGLSVVSGGFTRPSTHKRNSSRSRHRKDSDSHHHKKKRSRSHSRTRSRSRSSSRTRGKSMFGGMFGLDEGSSRRKHRDSGDYQKHNSSRASFFGVPVGNASRSSFFGFGRPSYYKRSPRSGFLSRAYKQLKKLIRNLIHYMKRHPVKVFFLVIMPLVTTGALAALLGRFGLRVPPGLEKMLGMASRAASGDSLGLVSDAVGMARDFGGYGGGGSGAERVRVRTHQTGTYGNDSWGDGIRGLTKMFS